MKVELITLHRVTNFGSLLQTYASQKMLTSLGVNVEVVDFVPEGLSFKRAIWPKGHSTIKKAIKLLPNIIVNAFQYSMVDQFLRSNINISKKRYKSYHDLEKDAPEADVYISGSDQLWNTQNNNPKDDIKAYYLQFAAPGKKRIAYSGSFGRYDFSEKEKMNMRNWLFQYDAISVREEAGVRFINELGIDGAIHVLDPTLLLDKDMWSNFVNKERPSYNYVFVYNLNRNKTVEKIAKKIAKMKKIEIINFADTFEFIRGAKNRLFNKPEDLVYFIKNADYVVTDSFHGTAFSINFNTPFFTVPAPRFNTRLESILTLTELKDACYITSSTISDQIIDQEIEWEKVNSILLKERKKASNFLKGALYDE